MKLWILLFALLGCTGVRVEAEDGQWHGEVARRLGLQCPCRVEKQQLGVPLINPTFKITFEDGSRTASVVSKQFAPWVGYEVSTDPGERFKSELEMNRAFREAGLHAPEILLAIPKERVLVTRFVEGVGFDKIVQAALAVGEAELEPVSRLGAALAQAHRQGLRVGDLTPPNVLWSEGKVFFVDLDQASRDQDPAWDIAEFLYFPLLQFPLLQSPAADPAASRRVAEAFLRGYRSQGGDPAVIQAAQDEKYFSPFALVVNSEVAKGVREGLAGIQGAVKDGGSPERLRADAGLLFGERGRGGLPGVVPPVLGTGQSLGGKNIPLSPHPTLSPNNPAPPAPPSGVVRPVRPAAGTRSHAEGASSPSRKKAFFVRHPWLVRLALAPAVKLLYRLDTAGVENLPKGPVLILANHSAPTDSLLLTYASGRTPRFVVRRGSNPLFRWLFKQAGAIQIEPGGPKEEVEAALAGARQALMDGDTVAIFPEGQFTENGNLVRFRRGFERIVEGLNVPVIPAHVDGLWGSVLSHKKGPSLWSKLKEVPRPVTVRFGQPLEKVDIQTAREAVQLLGAESMEGRIRDSEKTLSRAFLETAKRYWGRRAVADSTGKDLNYGETLTGSILLANRLEKRLKGENVGVLLPSSVGGALANTALGVLGKVPVNLNYTASREAMGHAIEKAQITAVVTSRKFLEQLKARGLAVPEAELLFLEDLAAEVPPWKKAVTYAALRVLPRPAVEAVYLRKASRSLDDNGTILFTSGSSGLPKGVELTHANIRANVEMIREVFPYAKHHTVLGALPFFHSFGYTMTLWSALLSGFSAVYHPNPLESDALAKLAAQYQPTLLLSTPTFLRKYIQRIPAEAFSSLKFVFAGAEKLRPELAEEFKGKFGTRPYEGYGATELSPGATANLPDVEKGESGKAGQVGNKPGSVGHPLPGSAVRVVDPETFKSIPYGRQGLILVKGPHVMKGYLGEPAKTAEALRDGWYVTGDMGTLDRDGFVTLTGRLSRFSKIAGEMVSHVAVEEKLHKAAGMTQQTFVVTAVPDVSRGEKLVVLYVDHGGDLGELLSKARELGLPNLWLPARENFYGIEKIPMLGSGKLDLKAIKELALKLAK